MKRRIVLALLLTAIVFCAYSQFVPKRGSLLEEERWEELVELEKQEKPQEILNWFYVNHRHYCPTGPMGEHHFGRTVDNPDFFIPAIIFVTLTTPETLEWAWLTASNSRLQRMLILATLGVSSFDTPAPRAPTLPDFKTNLKLYSLKERQKRMEEMETVKKNLPRLSSILYQMQQNCLKNMNWTERREDSLWRPR